MTEFPSECRPMPPVILAVPSATSARQANGRVICGTAMNRMSLLIARCSVEMPRLTISRGR